MLDRFKTALFGAITSLLATSSQATVETIPSGSIWGPFFGLQGSNTLTFSTDMLSFGDVARLDATDATPGQVAITRDVDGWLTALTLSAPVASLTWDTDTQSVLAWSTNAGANMIAPVSGISSGGSLTLANLSVDVNSKQVYADVLGANGIGAQTHVSLLKWDQLETSMARIGSVGGLDVMSMTQTLHNLSMTDTGLALWTQSLGLYQLGAVALQADASNFGDMQTTFQFKTTPGYLNVTPTVPEPSTYAMMGLGLVCLAGAVRRRAAH